MCSILQPVVARVYLCCCGVYALYCNKPEPRIIINCACVFVITGSGRGRKHSVSPETLPSLAVLYLRVHSLVLGAICVTFVRPDASVCSTRHSRDK